MILYPGYYRDEGYTPDKAKVTGITVSHDSKPEDTIIYYTENPENKKTSISESKEVKRKITYYRVNDDGSVSQTWSKTQTVTFTRVGTVDGNGKKSYNPWNSYTWEAEDVTGMAGYTPDITVIPAVTFTPDNPPKDVAVYFRNNTDGEDYIKPGEVVYSVTFKDGQGKTISSDQVEEGKAAKAPADPKREGYSFAGWDKKFDKVTDNLVINAKWVKNKTEWVTDSKTVKRTIEYFYADGKPVIATDGKPAVETDTATFRRNGLKDLVTGKVEWNAWSGAMQFDSRSAMSFNGYTPSMKTIPAATVTSSSKDWVVKVYYTKNGQSDKFTGVRESGGVWKIYKSGKVNTGFTGLAQTPDGNWYYFRKGVFCSSYTGLTKSAKNNWYYVKNGKYDTSYTGMTQAESGNWYYVKNGQYCKSFTGLAPAPGGKWMYVKKGVFDKTFTGLAKAASGKWYYVKNGYYDSSFTGIVLQKSSGISYYVKNGKYASTFSGKITYLNKTYNIKKGKVV